MISPSATDAANRTNMDIKSRPTGRVMRLSAVFNPNPTIYSISETFDVGVDMGSPVSKEYDRNNEFSGDLEKVVVRLGS